MKLAIVGIRGIPNNYGGFETLAEYLVEHLSSEIDITVYCSSVDMDSNMQEHNGAQLRYIPITSHGAKGIIYDSLALIKAINSFDKVLFLGFGGGYVMPFLSKKQQNKLILNIGGLDWQRNKWSSFAQKIIKTAERLLIKNCGRIVADNIGIQKYIKETYNKNSTLIAYGGDQAIHREISDLALAEYPFLKDKYAFTVTRIQSDNNIEMILESFCMQDVMPLVMVGNWNNSEYGKIIKAKFQNHEGLILLDAIYDRKKLDILRSNCTIYIHGHSAGGTNPSLTEAMYLGLPVFAYSSGYNEYTTNNLAIYFNSAEELASQVENYTSLPIANMGSKLMEYAKTNYRWSDVANKYKRLILN